MVGAMAGILVPRSIGGCYPSPGMNDLVIRCIFSEGSSAGVWYEGTVINGGRGSANAVAALANQHAIAVAVKAVAGCGGVPIRRQNFLAAGEGRDQHQQR